MDALPTIAIKWELTRTALDKLLASLDPDHTRAAERYEIIRQKLITFFENRGCTVAEELVDDTMNRVAKRLDEGVTIYAANPDSYFYSVARNVLREYYDILRPAPPLPCDEPCCYPREEDDDIEEREQEETRFDCQKRCLERLPRELRELVTEYYREEPGIKMKKKREDLAARLGMTPNALRIRACRIRDKLDECAAKCLKHASNGEIKPSRSHNGLRSVAGR